jgi:hypothetical protein
MESPFIPFLGKPAGIIFDLAFQVVQVLLIGFKFYPILAVSDDDANWFIYLISFIYMSYIWLIRFITKAFCSKTEAFVRQILRKIKNTITTRAKAGYDLRYNVSNAILGLFSDADNPNEKYISIMKSKVPDVFRNTFGSYHADEVNQTNLIIKDPLDEDRRLFAESFGPSFSFTDALLTTTTTTTNGPLNSNGVFYETLSTVASSSTSQISWRETIKNKTSKIKFDNLNLLKTDSVQVDFISLFENLPVYITLSYLVARFGLLFLSSFIDTVMQLRRSAREKKRLIDDIDKMQDLPSFSKDIMNQNEKKEILGKFDSYLRSLNDNFKMKDQLTHEILLLENHNFEYIKNLLINVQLFEQEDTDKTKFNDIIKGSTSIIGRVKKQSHEVSSYLMHALEKNASKIYKPVPHMLYSKQYYLSKMFLL